MRQYPRRVYKSLKEHILVNDEAEEIKAGKEGYESHWNPEINAKRKGTDREVLREEPIKEIKELVTQEKIEETKQDSKPVVFKEVKKRKRKAK